MTMRELIGQHHNDAVNQYLSEQWGRETIYKGTAFRLNNVPEAEVQRLLELAVRQLGLQANGLLEHTMMRPYINHDGRMSPMLVLTSCFYASLLASVARTQASIIYEDDQVTYTGKDKHIQIKKKPGRKSGQSIAGAINGTTTEGEQFSLYINAEQWRQMQSDYTNNKLNGCEYVDIQWQREVEMGFLYHRLIDEFVGALLDEQDNPSYLQYRAAVDYEQHFYQLTSGGSRDVYTAKGYKIGKAVRMFDDADVIAAEQSQKAILAAQQHLKVVVDNDKNPERRGVTAAVVEANNECFEEWGTF